MEYTVNYYVKCSLLCAIGRNKGVNGTPDHTFIYTYKHLGELDMFHLRMKLHSKLSLNRCNYTFFQSDDLLRICLPGMVHDHQRLLVPDGRPTAALSLPATLLDHPGSRNLDEGAWNRSFTLFRMTR